MTAKDHNISADLVRSLLDYDPLTGFFRWKERPGVLDFNNQTAGKRAGTVRPDGYRFIVLSKVCYCAHRLAWLYVNGSAAPEQIDHINGARDDNRIENLRLATHKQNMRNRGVSKRSKTGIKGVFFDKKRGTFKSHIMADGKHYFLGHHATANGAHQAYLTAAKKFHREFARLP